VLQDELGYTWRPPRNKISIKEQMIFKNRLTLRQDGLRLTKVDT
jgi:hypothetical protein